MKQLHIETRTKQYDVTIGSNLISALLSFIHNGNYRKVAIITDETVGALHLETLKEGLATIHPVTLTLCSGEKSKAISEWERAHAFLLANGFDRKSLVLAFGGGAIGDVAGFVAGTYMRGIAFIGVPTTLLAHDSSVGGKVAVNHALGKNMIGVFHQPEAVFYDMNWLATLPQTEWLSGFAELMKHGFIGNEALLHNLYEKCQRIEDVHSPHLEAWIAEGIAVKANIVQQDETEQSVRAYLNFGHTLAHALER
ncbi:MAG: 3-dehydroquinate synthase family protein, partial [Bacilli bacterium]